MGMYTKLFLETPLVKDVPEVVLYALRCMMGLDGWDEGVHPLPDHPLFKTTRWRGMLWGASYYFNNISHCSLEWDDIGKEYLLAVSTDLKNYDSEIEHFIDWLRPHVDGEGMRNGVLGFMMYEEWNLPQWIFVDPKRKVGDDDEVKRF